MSADIQLRTPAVCHIPGPEAQASSNGPMSALFRVDTDTMDKMETEPTSSTTDIATAVRTARAELAAVIRALTQVLDAVAESDSSEKSERNENDLPQAEREKLMKKRSITPVLARFEALRTAVQHATVLHANKMGELESAEKLVGEEERKSLRDRKAALVNEVRGKNKRIKVLIDHLRELHRDIVVMLACYFKHYTPHNRKG